MVPPLDKETLTLDLFAKLFLNELILASIFGNFNIRELYSFRLVCKIWKSVINQRISKDDRAHIYCKRDFVDSFEEDVDFVKTLKIATLSFKEDWTFLMTFTKSEDGDEKSMESWEICKEIGDCGDQVKTLELFEPDRVDLTIRHKITRFKALFFIFPNLKQLEADIKVDAQLFAEEFQDFVFPNLQILHLNCSDVVKGSEEEFVRNILKIFPNLIKNFNCETLDCVLMELIKEGKVAGAKMRKFQDSTAYEIIYYSEFLKQVPANLFPLTHLEIASIELINHEVLTDILKNFSMTLTTVKLLSDIEERCRSQSPTEIVVPPLPKLRKMWLEMPSFDYPEHLYTCWNLGKQLGKDFPLLEYFAFKPQTNSYFNDEEDEVHYFEEEFIFGEQCRQIWEPFVPLSAEGEVDLSPLKFLKFVDLSIPKNWIGPEENRDWGNRFLEVYLKLYGCGGKGNIQSMIDWLK